MRVERIAIKNFKGILEEDIEINGHDVYVIGPNGIGKTSFIDAIFKTINNDNFPPEPLTRGEKNGSVKIDLGKVTAEITYNEKNKPTLALWNNKGESYPSPRKMLQEIAGIVDFDVKAFLNLTPKEKVEFIKQLVGIDFTDQDVEYQKSFDRRRFAKSKLKDLEAQQLPINKNVDFIDPLELQKSISDKEKHNQTVKDVNYRVEERSKKINERLAEIEELHKKIQSLKDLNEEDELKNSEAEAWLVMNDIINIEELQKKFEEALENNRLFEEKKKAIALREKLKEAELEVEREEKVLQEIEELKRRVISETQLPVPGLSFDDNQLYLDGLPFEDSQINTARQIIAGLQINLHLLKEVRIARFDGSLLDRKSLKFVQQWAKENDLQLFVEFVDHSENESLKIEIVE